MCSGDKIILMNHNVSDRSRRHIEPERLPVFAVVDREIDGLLCAAIKQSLAYWVFTNGIDDAAVGQSLHDLLPCLAAVVRAKNMRPQIVKAKCVYCRIGRVCVETARIDQR